MIKSVRYLFLVVTILFFMALFNVPDIYSKWLMIIGVCLSTGFLFLFNWDALDGGISG